MTPVIYQNCRCFSWPLQPRTAVGRCKRCGTRPDGPTFRSQEKALEAFRQEHGHLPKEIV